MAWSSSLLELLCPKRALAGDQALQLSSTSAGRGLPARAEVVHDHRQELGDVASGLVRWNAELASDLADRVRSERALYLVRRDRLVLSAAQPRLGCAAQACALELLKDAADTARLALQHLGDRAYGGRVSSPSGVTALPAESGGMFKAIEQTHHFASFGLTRWT